MPCIAWTPTLYEDCMLGIWLAWLEWRDAQRQDDERANPFFTLDDWVVLRGQDTPSTSTPRDT